MLLEIPFLSLSNLYFPGKLIIIEIFFYIYNRKLWNKPDYFRKTGKKPKTAKISVWVVKICYLYRILIKYSPISNKMCLFFCVFSLHFQTTTRPLFINLFHTANTGTLCSQQEPYFVVSRNPMKSAGTLCGQQQPLLLAGTMNGNSNISTWTAAGTLHGQQEPHNYALRQQYMHLNSSRNPFWPAGTLDVNRNQA